MQTNFLINYTPSNSEKYLLNLQSANTNNLDLQNLRHYRILSLEKTEL